MPDIQVTPHRAAAAHAAARARANKILAREAHLVSAFDLSEEIRIIDARADELCQLCEFTAANTLRATAARLRALCPEN